MSASMKNAIDLIRKIATFGTTDLSQEANAFLRSAGETTATHINKPVFACVKMQKFCTEDNFESGVDSETNFSGTTELNIERNSFDELVKACGDYFALTIDKVSVDDDPVYHFDYCRDETKDCEEPTAEQRELWKQGKFKIYEARFRFYIEKRYKQTISMDDIESSQIHIA